MRIKKRVALIGAILILVGCLVIYRMTDYTLYSRENSNDVPFKYVSRRTARPLIMLEKIKVANDIINGKKLEFEQPKNKTCGKHSNETVVNIQMSKIYDKLKFDNIDGGVWKQGWNIKTDPSRWNFNKKLRVFIVPHSHNDPGWIKTFEDYYATETRHILNNMLKKLTLDSKKKFIWAEISFFALWWDELTGRDQRRVKMLVNNGQLEFVTGGWVMNDEANTHYYSMVTQLIEGHKWLKDTLNVHPKSGWTIDPFGESPVMPYLLKKMGIDNLVIQRVHYSIKKLFAQQKNLEFRWRQFWDSSGETDVLTHMTPFYSYDIPHTCGPDPKICCQFDFKRLPGTGVSCPWGEAPKVITEKNVATRAEILLDQYRKKSELYRTNTILVPLGDDFRYQSPGEWDHQFNNYYKIINYINNNPELHAEVKFGTLTEFFQALREESPESNFPTLSGDFFTYADRDDHYWSGFYTSRPFYKRMDRVLLGYHRAAEILFALSWGAKNIGNPSWLLEPQMGFAKILQDSRRSLSLFQHHDGVTGTARDNVMEDYALKMMGAVTYSQHVIQQLCHFLLASRFRGYLSNSEAVYFDFDNKQKHNSYFPERQVLRLDVEVTKNVLFFNSVTYTRKKLVSFLVNTPYLQVRSPTGVLIDSQISPVFSQEAIMDNNRYEVSFVVEVPPLGLAIYSLNSMSSDTYADKNTLSKVTILNPNSPVISSRGFSNVTDDFSHKFTLENDQIKLLMNNVGMLQSIYNKETDESVAVNINFFSYHSRQGKDKSGAYLFLPGFDKIDFKPALPLIRVFEGPLYSRVEVQLSNVKHVVTLYNTPDLFNHGIYVENVVDISQENNYELGMKITTNIKSGDFFYTDLNGFQMIKRKRYAKLPIQGNFYPMPSAAFIEDENNRLTIVSAQPLGVSSLKEGELEILQDRRLDQDDNRGLGQGVTDNRMTTNEFKLILETRKKNCKIVPSLLSINGYISSQSLLYPIIKMISKIERRQEMLRVYSPSKSLNPEIHLLSVRTFDEETTPFAGLIFHKTHLDRCFLNSNYTNDSTLNLQTFLPDHFSDTMVKTSLSFTHKQDVVDRSEEQTLCYMDFLSVMLS